MSTKAKKKRPDPARAKSPKKSASSRARTTQEMPAQRARRLQGFGNLAAEAKHYVLTVNSGSSSIKFALYPVDLLTTPVLSGRIERIGLLNPILTIRDSAKKVETRPLTAPDHRAA